MVTSKRVSNAKSEKFYKKSIGSKKVFNPVAVRKTSLIPTQQPQSVRKHLSNMSGSPLILLAMFFLLVMSGVFVFIMSLPEEKFHRMRFTSDE